MRRRLGNFGENVKFRNIDYELKLSYPSLKCKYCCISGHFPIKRVQRNPEALNNMTAHTFFYIHILKVLSPNSPYKSQI